MRMIGYGFYALAAIDFFSYSVAGVDLTGVSWSPIVLAIIGSVILRSVDG